MNNLVNHLTKANYDFPVGINWVHLVSESESELKND